MATFQSYTDTPTYKPQFQSMVTLQEELSTSNSTQLKEWISNAMQNQGMVKNVLKIMKNGLYSLSNADGSDLNELLALLQNIKADLENEDNMDITMSDKIHVPSPPPFSFEDTNTPAASIEPLEKSQSNHNNPITTETIESMESIEIAESVETTENILSLPNPLLSSVCQYLDLQSLLTFEKCNKRICAIAHEPDSYNNDKLFIEYSHALNESMDILKLARFKKCKLITFDHFSVDNGNDKELWAFILNEIVNDFVNLQTVVFGCDWIGISILAQAINENSDSPLLNTLQNITIKHAFQKQIMKKTSAKQKSRSRTRSKTKQLSMETESKGCEEEKVFWERSDKEEVTDMTIEQSVHISQLILTFSYLNNVTFDMVQLPPTFELLNALRSMPIESISFNDCMELGLFDDNEFIYEHCQNNKEICKPLLCQTLIIRDIDTDTFEEFFEPKAIPYFWPVNTLKNLMIHWNITKRDYDKYLTANIKALQQQKMKNKRKKNKSYKRMNTSNAHTNLMPNLSGTDTLYVSIINGNGLKSLIVFFEQTQLISNLQTFVLRIPKPVSQIALNVDLLRLLGMFSENENRLLHLRFEIIEFPWIGIWNTLNVIAANCIESDASSSEETYNVFENLETLEIQLFSPCLAVNKSSRSVKKKGDTKDLIVKIKNSVSRIKSVNYLGLFVNESQGIDESVCKDPNYLLFERKNGVNMQRYTSHMDQYWEPVVFDPYA